MALAPKVRSHDTALRSPGGNVLPHYGLVKSVMEWIAALAMFVATLPFLIVLCAVLKCTSRGPALYSQMRLGRHGRPFRLYKLRTMADGCEAETGPVWSIAGDPRATVIGRWLRATHLDELPQLWNVLRGEMALIGPRPERPEIATQIERALPEFRHRLVVRPGLTGLAQMLRPPDEDLNTVCHKLAHDLEYIRRMGPVLDVRIALATGLSIVRPGLARILVGAYGAERPIKAVESAPTLRLTAPLPVGRSALPSPQGELSKAA